MNDATLSGSCGGGNANEVVFEWVAPATGQYRISTAGSSYDTVLYVLEDDCEGNELACHADVSVLDQSSELVVELAQGQRYLLVVDGDLGATGQAQLNIEGISCPNLTLQGQSLPVVLNSNAGTNEYEGECTGASGTNELSLLWRPPQAGFYRIEATALAGGDLDPALHLERGSECGGELLSCNARGDSGTTSAPYPAQVWRKLEANEAVTLIIDADSGSGPVSLDATRVGAICPAFQMNDPFVGVVHADLALEVDTMTTSCGENYSESLFKMSQPDFLVTVQAPAPPSGCSYDLIGDSPMSVAIIEGACEGREIVCERTQDFGGVHVATIDLPQDGGVYTIAVSPLDVLGSSQSGTDTFALEASCFTP